MENISDITLLEENFLQKKLIEKLTDELQKARQDNARLESELLYQKYENDRLKQVIFGSKRERFIAQEDPRQLKFDLEFETIEAPAIKTEHIEYERQKTSKPKKKGHARMPLPADLPREVIIIEPTEKTEGARRIGEEITEVLEYEPGRIYVKRYVRPKYVTADNQAIIIAEQPTFPIPKGNAAASLLAHICVNKYVYHLPLYRQSKMFQQMGVRIPESNLSGWFSKTCSVLEPLYEVLRKVALQVTYIQVDESTIRVQIKDLKGKTHQGYLWVYNSPGLRLVFFDYRKGRSREGPIEILANYPGAIQTDGYSAYNIFEQNIQIILLACMAHVRRKFIDAQENDPVRAKYALTLIQKLYKIEEIARKWELSPDRRLRLRQFRSVPIMQELHNWLLDNAMQTLPKSPIGKAISYTLNLWQRLERYTTDGRFEIDNNLIENAIRPLALGRKNYLFAGSEAAARRTAMMYSFFGCCKQNGVDPFLWLKDVLERIQEHKANRLEELLPHNWKK